MWAAKALAILVTGDQPPLLFQLPLVLFPLGLIGLHSLLGPGGGRKAMFGGRAAYAALVFSVATGVAAGVAPDAVVGVGIAAATLATVLGLIFLGLAARDAQHLPPPLRWLPLALGVATPLAVTVVGGLLEAIHERLLEVPLLALALGWVVLGTLVAAELRTTRRVHPDPQESPPRLGA